MRSPAYVLRLAGTIMIDDKSASLHYLDFNFAWNLRLQVTLLYQVLSDVFLASKNNDVIIGYSKSRL